MTEGSEAVISDILATRDPRELTLSETGERGPTPLEMRAGLPAGSFSPFDFEREFQARHGVKPEDVDKSWHSHYSSRGSFIVTVSPNREIGPPRTEAPSPTLPTRGMEIIRTPGVTRDQDCVGCYKIFQEDGPYNNFMDLLLIGIMTASITLLHHGKVDLENMKLLLETRDQLQLMVINPDYSPIVPPSDMTSTAGPPSTVGPLASVSETAIPWKKVDFSISNYAGETTRDSSQRDTQTKDMPTTQIEDRPITVPRSTTAVVSTVDSSPQRETLGHDGGGQIHDVTSLEVRDMDKLRLQIMISTMESTLIFSCHYLIDQV